VKEADKQELMQQFRLSEHEWLDILLMPALRDRIQRLLLHLSRIAGGDGSVVAVQEDMADVCGACRESISRELAKMTREGLISTRRADSFRVGAKAYTLSSALLRAA